MSFEGEPKIEDFEYEGLSPAEKRDLAAAWLKMAVDNVVMPADISDWTNEEVRNWLFETLMSDTRRLAEEWNLRPDETLIARIKDEKDIEERARLEMEYLQSVRKTMDDFLAAHPKVPDSGYKWDSWPKKMREEKSFNCVGGTLLGMTFLEKAGIASYYGNPDGHVLNIVKLATGDWVYADFTNNHVRKIKTGDALIVGIRTMRLEEPGIPYRYVPIFENSTAPASVLGNFDSMQSKARDWRPWGGRKAERQTAKEILAGFRKEFKSNDFDVLQRKLYPSRYELNFSEAMIDENERLAKMKAIFAPAREFYATLKLEQEKTIALEKAAFREQMRRFFLEGDKSVSELVSPEMQKMLGLIMEKLEKVKTKKPEFFRFCVDFYLHD